MSNTLACDLAVVAQAALPHLQKAAPVLTSVTWDASSALAGGGDSVICRYVATNSASIWTSTFAPSDVTAVKVTVTMQEPIFNTVGFSPNEQASYNEQQLADTFIGPMIQGVVDAVADKTFRQFPGTATYNAYSASSTSFGFDELQASALKLLASGSNNLHALLNAPMEYGLNKDLAGTYGASAQVINAVEGQYGKQVGKVKIWPAYNFPKISTGCAGIVFDPQAVILATRVPPALPGMEQQIITDPRTGLSVSIERWGDLTTGKLNYSVKLSMGVLAGRTFCTAHLLDADNP